jgi:uncharacterized NAD(P)/FAD-binding protein YdhS
MSSVVIVGGGFSGAVTAVNLVRLTDAPLAVTVVNAGRPLARGVAYGTPRPEHLLNVVARNMSALADQPDHFVEWLGTRSDFAHLSAAELREQFIPRRVYGDYLQALFLWYRSAFADGRRVRIDALDAEVVDVVPAGDRVSVVTASGAALPADKVVLATGNPPPASLPGIDVEHPAYFADPWVRWEQHLPDRTGDVVLLGTGLTMVDAFLTLSALPWRGKIIAVSRNGLLPLSHFKGFDYPAFPGRDVTGATLEEMQALVQTHCAELQRRGLNPAILVDKLRPHTQRLWRQFTRAEKLRFLREFRTPWNVTRHRIAESIHNELAAAAEAGRLEVVKGDIRAVRRAPAGLEVVLAGPGGERVLGAAAVVNCTGPAEGPGGGRSALYENLLERGLVSPDEVNLGVRAADDFAVLDEDGVRSPWLLAVGPPLKGLLWESTAVPELRNQAFRAAETVVADLHALRAAAVGRLDATYADVLEYSI